MRRIWLCCALLVPFTVFAQRKSGGITPANLNAILHISGNNRAEVQNAIIYFQRKGEADKLAALYFLLRNMPEHLSSSYYWVDIKNNSVAFNEFDYPTFDKALDAFDNLRKTHPGVHPHPTNFDDLTTVKSAFLIDNIEHAFIEWKRSAYKNISFNDFCEYILPYRVSVEPLQLWRGTYEKRYNFLTTAIKTKGIENGLSYFGEDLKLWFEGTFGENTERHEPLPRLGAQQLLFRKKGPCEDIADLTVFALRSQGVPVTVDIVPAWATSTGGHFLNAVFDPQMRLMDINVSGHNGLTRKKGKEPGKVIRTTFAKQNHTVADLETPNNIPDNFLRSRTYIDVTDQYWETGNISVDLMPTSKKAVFASVFNHFQWKPIWWAGISNNKATFTKMCKGAVYLPIYFDNGILHAAAWPVLLDYERVKTLRPLLNQRTILRITDKDNYIKIQANKLYRLYFWNGKWELSGTQVGTQGNPVLIFPNTPKDALYLLVPEYSKGKDRPFIQEDNGSLSWW